MPVLNVNEREAIRTTLETNLRRNVPLHLYTSSGGGLYIPGRECRDCATVTEGRLLASPAARLYSRRVAGPPLALAPVARRRRRACLRATMSECWVLE